MNNQKIAQELVAVAKELTAGGSSAKLKKMAIALDMVFEGCKEVLFDESANIDEKFGSASKEVKKQLVWLDGSAKMGAKFCRELSKELQ